MSECASCFLCPSVWHNVLFKFILLCDSNRPHGNTVFFLNNMHVSQDVHSLLFEERWRLELCIANTLLVGLWWSGDLDWCSSSSVCFMLVSSALSAARPVTQMNGCSPRVWCHGQLFLCWKIEGSLMNSSTNSLSSWPGVSELFHLRAKTPLWQTPEALTLSFSSAVCVLLKG